MVDSLEVDQYIWGIIEQLCKTNVDDISIDANAAWKPSGGTAVNVKDEDSKGICHSQVYLCQYHWLCFSCSSLCYLLFSKLIFVPIK